MGGWQDDNSSPWQPPSNSLASYLGNGMGGLDAVNTLFPGQLQVTQTQEPGTNNFNPSTAFANPAALAGLTYANQQTSPDEYTLNVFNPDGSLNGSQGWDTKRHGFDQWAAPLVQAAVLAGAGGVVGGAVAGAGSAAGVGGSTAAGTGAGGEAAAWGNALGTSGGEVAGGIGGGSGGLLGDVAGNGYLTSSADKLALYGDAGYGELPGGLTAGEAAGGSAAAGASSAPAYGGVGTSGAGAGTDAVVNGSSMLGAGETTTAETGAWEALKGAGTDAGQFLKDNPTLGKLLFSGALSALSSSGGSSGGTPVSTVAGSAGPAKQWTTPIQLGIQPGSQPGAQSGLLAQPVQKPSQNLNFGLLGGQGQANDGAWRWLKG